MTPVVDNSLRKAADFIRGLDPESAAAMLGRLSADEASALRSVIGDLHDQQSHEASNNRVSEDGTVELQLGSARVSTPDAVPQQPVEKTLFDGAAWLRSLKHADPAAIADYLAREQPRAIALILGYLNPELAAGVLQSFDPGEQSRVVAQLAEQRDTDPDSLRLIANGLADWITQQQEEQQRRTSRVATIRQILAATPESQRRQIIAALADTEPEVAVALVDTLPPQPVEEPTPPQAIVEPVAPAKKPAPAIPFDQLDRLDGRALAEALGRLGSRTALLALAAAPDTLVQRLASGLPRGAARDLRNRIHRVGPTTLSEIDRAQAALSTAAGQIAAERRAARLASSKVEG